jgi:molybdopterin biosynthesis enzyme
VTFHLFVQELLSRLASHSPADRFLAAEAAAPFPANSEREFFQPCLLQYDGARLTAIPSPWQGSADLFALARAQATETTGLALARRHPNASPLARGESVQVLPIFP